MVQPWVSEVYIWFDSFLVRGSKRQRKPKVGSDFMAGQKCHGGRCRYGSKPTKRGCLEIVVAPVVVFKHGHLFFKKEYSRILTHTLVVVSLASDVWFNECSCFIVWIFQFGAYISDVCVLQWFRSYQRAELMYFHVLNHYILLCLVVLLGVPFASLRVRCL